MVGKKIQVSKFSQFWLSPGFVTAEIRPSPKNRHFFYLQLSVQGGRLFVGLFLFFCFNCCSSEK